MAGALQRWVRSRQSGGLDGPLRNRHQRSPTMRVNSLLFAIGSLATQLTLAAPASAATDIFISRANNDFAVASSNPVNGPSQQVFVTRTTGVSGGIITQLSFYYVAPNGCFFGGFGQIPNQDF